MYMVLFSNELFGSDHESVQARYYAKRSRAADREASVNSSQYQLTTQEIQRTAKLTDTAR